MEEKAIRHFVITQFNLRLWSKDKLNKSTVTDEWLDNRIKLFEKYCLPSIKAQKNKNFVWLCLFDSNTSQKYIDKINEYKKQCDQFLPCFLNEDETKEWLNYVRNKISQQINTNTHYIVTTNLDNDDAIHCEYISRIQNEISRQQPKEKTLYSFVYGYQYFTDINMIFKMRYPHNHFLSLVELNNGEIDTIRSGSHAKARKKYQTVDIEDQPYWIEFVHTNNVNNDLRITSRIRYSFILKTLNLKDFGLNIILNKQNNLNKIISKFPRLFLTTAKRKLNKKLNKY